MGPVAVFVMLYVFQQLLFVKAYRTLKSFLAMHHELGAANLEEYKGVVRINMKLALLTIVLMVSGLVLGLWLISQHGMAALLLVLAANAVTFGTGKVLKKVEIRLRSLPVTDPQLALEYARINEAWLKKPLPDF